MRRIKRLVAFCLCVVMTCVVLVKPVAALEYTVTEYGVYGTDYYPLSYPVTESFMSRMDVESYWGWYKNDLWAHRHYGYTELEILSTYWLEWHDFNGPEKLCKEYSERFQDVLSKTDNYTPQFSAGYGAELYDYSVDEYSWDGRTLKLRCSADFDISYHFYYSQMYYGYTISLTGDVRPIPYLAVTDKTDGSLVDFGIIPNFSFSPELRYGNDYSTIDPEHISEDILEMINSDTTVNYTCTATKSIDIQMPEYFDPDKHELSVYFRIYYPGFPFETIDEVNLLSAATISNDGFGIPSETTEPDPEPGPGTEGDKVYGSFTETGWYGWDEEHSLAYPVTGRFVNSLKSDSLWDWYNTEYRGVYGDELLEYMSRLWYLYYYIGDPEVLPQVYLDRFAGLLSGAGDNADGKYRLYGASAKDGKLSLHIGAEFYMKYSYYQRQDESGDFTGPYYTFIDRRDVYACLAIRGKENGELVHFGRISGSGLSPEYRYGYGERVAEYDWEYYGPYTSVAEKELTVTLPEFFDPEKHTLEIYFGRSIYSDDGYEAIPLYDPVFYARLDIPVADKPELRPGDANSDGAVNLSDVTLMMKYIAGWDVSPDMELADHNRNGRVDLEDVSYALKVIAGWNV